MWKQRFRLSTALYICCRYALVANVLYLLAISHKLGSTCDFWYKVITALSVIGRAAVTAVFCLRTHAVWGKNKWVLAYMSTVGLACVALDITHVPGARCVGSSALPVVSKMLSISVVIFESSSAFLTAIRCVMAFHAGDQHHGLLRILFEQGILYFCTISIFTTSGVALNYRAPPGFLQRLPDAFTLPLSCILTARFLLHLREWQVAGEDGGSLRLSTALKFRTASASASHAAILSGIMSVDIDDFGSDPLAGTAADGEKAMEVQLASDNGSFTKEAGPVGNGCDCD